ncbi:nucleoporin Nup85-like protein [Spinellus fusiger]|nr:nucleoporin Nup85-like protein [Spinellus fusiger]
MPSLFSSTTHGCVKEKWHAWHRQCQEVCQNYTYINTNDTLGVILNILAGDEETIIKTSTFPENLMGLLLYNDPFQNQSKLALVTKRVELPDDVDKITELCHHIMTECWSDVLEILNDSWTETHLGHLLLAAGWLVDEDAGKDSDREVEICTDPIYYVICDYAEHLVSKYSMWHEAFDYLSVCGANKEIWMENLLKDPFIKDNVSFTKELLSFCQERQFNKVQRCLFKIMADTCEQNGDLYQATLHYARAKNYAKLDVLATGVLKNFLTQGTLEGLVSVEDRTAALSDSKTYAFLMLYEKFRDYLRTDRVEEASPLLLELFKIFSAPEEFRLVLLVDSLPYLISSTNYFNKKELYTLMHNYVLAFKTQDQSQYLSHYYSQHYPSEVAVEAKAIKRLLHTSLCYNLAVIMTA